LPPSGPDRLVKLSRFPSVILPSRLSPSPGGGRWLRSARHEVGFVRRKGPLASFGELPLLPLASWLLGRIGWRRRLRNPSGTDFSRSQVQESEGNGPTQVGPTRSCPTPFSPVRPLEPASFGAARDWLRSARLASFGAIGFVRAIAHLANGFVRRDWLRSAWPGVARTACLSGSRSDTRRRERGPVPSASVDPWPLAAPPPGQASCPGHPPDPEWGVSQSEERGNAGLDALRHPILPRPPLASFGAEARPNAAGHGRRPFLLDIKEPRRRDASPSSSSGAEALLSSKTSAGPAVPGGDRSRCATSSCF
jgi:hypothetical protein